MAPAVAPKTTLTYNSTDVPSDLSVELHDTYKQMHAAGVPIPPFREPKIYQNISELIGWTPLVEVHQITQAEGAVARIAAKLEGFNPCTSVKDRIALGMILDAEEKGWIKPGVSTLIEGTSGNTGIAIAFVGVRRGYRVIVVMPHTHSLERRTIVRALGAEVMITDGRKGVLNQMAFCDELLATIPNSHMLGQFTNGKNPLAHFTGTGPEIWAQTDGKVDMFIGGVGTGGTISGVGHYLKGMNPNVKVVAVEPALSPIMQGGKHSTHLIQGIGSGFIPDTTDVSVVDEILSVTNEESVGMARRLALEEGLLVGISSGASFAAALKVAKRPENAGKLIVALLPSAGGAYVSTVLFRDIKEEMEKLEISEPASFQPNGAQANGAQANSVEANGVQEKEKVDVAQLKEKVKNLTEKVDGLDLH